MNRFLWLVVNLGLVVAACAFGLWLTGNDPAGHWNAVAAVALEQPGQTPGQRPQPEPVEPSQKTSPRQSATTSQNLDALWRRTLFRPERTEDVVLQQEAEKAQEAPEMKVDFELVGVAMLNDRRVAIIHVRQGATNRPPPTRPAVRVRGPAGQVPQPAEESKAPPVKKLFRESEEVGGTGYILAEIRKREVVLKKGDEELIVSLEMGDDASQSRRTEAASALAETRDTPAAPATEEPAANPASPTNVPPPPPPPPAPGVATPATGAPSSSRNESLEQRVQRMREERERLLRERMTPSQNPN